MHQSASNSNLLVAVITAGALFLGFEVRDALSPLLVYLILVFLIQPLRDNQFVERLFWGLNILFGIWLFSELSGLLTPFIIALVLAFLFEPLMNGLLRLKMPRLLSAFLITVFGVGGIVLMVALLSPEIGRQMTAFGSIVPLIPDYLQAFINWIFSFEIFTWFSIDVDAVKQHIIQSINEQLDNIGMLASNFTQTLWKSIPKVITTITTIILLPFLTFWFLNDFNRFSDAMARMLNKKPALSIRRYVPMAKDILNQYIRGQLIVMIIEITLYSTFFQLSASTTRSCSAFFPGRLSGSPTSASRRLSL